ncbi:MAG: TfoX family protein [Myxococcales bacterium]|nr:TfoX family protein [Myxococcales bacterium]
MAYDQKLAARVRVVVAGREEVTEKEMFGGLAFLRGGKMFVGIMKEELMVRVGPDRHDEALARPHVRPMDFNGRPMKGYVFVPAGGFRTGPSLAAWVDWAHDFVKTLPAKKPASGKRGK